MSATPQRRQISERKAYFVLPFLLVLLIAAHPLGVIAQNVTIPKANGYDFSTLRRFAWKKNNLVTMRHPEDNKILDQKMMRAVTQEPASKGIVEDPANPDFYLFYHAGPGAESRRGPRLPQVSIAYNRQNPSPSGSSTSNVGAGSNVGFVPNVWRAP